MSSQTTAIDLKRALNSSPDSPPDDLSTRDDIFTMEEAARIKGVSYHTVSRAVRGNRLPARRSGRMVLIAGQDLDAWEPMRERAPRKYRQRHPSPRTPPGVVDLASGERAELARRLSALYETIHTQALSQPLEAFALWLAERIAQAMEFERVALWVINRERTEIEHLASYGDWYDAASPVGSSRFPFVPETMYLSQAGVFPLIDCWNEPPPLRLGPAFSAPLVAGDLHLGYIIGDHNGKPFTLSDAQVRLAQGLATQAALTIDLNRTRREEARRMRELERSLERMRLLADIALAVNAGDDLHALLRKAGRWLTLAMGGSCGGIGLQTDGDTVIGIWTLNGESLPDERIPINLNTLPGTLSAFHAGRPTLHTWERASETERGFWSTLSVHSCLITPFIIDGELVGATYVKYPEEHPALAGELIELNEAIAAQCVIAIKQARQRQELEAERRALRAASDDLRRLAARLGAAEASSVRELLEATETLVGE